MRAAIEEPREPEGAQTGGTTLEQLQEVIKEVLGAQYCLKPSAVTPSEIKQLPSLAHVRSRVEGLRDEFGAEAAAQLLRSGLNILNAGPAASVRERLGVVAAACDCDVPTALQLCTRSRGSSSLLAITPQNLQLSVTALRECLGLKTTQDIRTPFTKVPRILTLQPDLLRDRHATLRSILGLDGDALSKLLQRNPRLLSVKPALVKAGVEAVRVGLELGSWEEAVQVATRVPSCLCSNPQRITAVAGWLKHHLRMPPCELEQYKMLLTTSEAHLEQCLLDLPGALGIPPAEALLLAKATPFLLLKPAANIGQAWVEVKVAVSLQPGWREQLLAGSAHSLSMLLSTGDWVLRARIKEVMAAAPPPEQLPALSVLRASKSYFQATMQRVCNGTFRPNPREPADPLASIAAMFPSLAAQL